MLEFIDNIRVKVTVAQHEMKVVQTHNFLHFDRLYFEWDFIYETFNLR